MPPIGEVDAVLIELSREGAAETGFSKREKEKTPKHNLGTPFMYNPELGVMNFSGLSSSKMQIGHWYTVTPSWTEFIEPLAFSGLVYDKNAIISYFRASHKSVQAVLTADVVKETIPYCETAKTVNETGYRRTYYFGSGMILDVTTEYLLIWNDKLGLVSHFAKNLNQSFMHMQVVKFKALSQCESRHCAFHAVAVEPLYETRFRRLQGSSEAVVKAYGKLLYADCRNGDKVLLLDNEKRLLLIGSNVGLEADEVVNVVYYKIQTQQGSVYISGFYFQTGEDQEFWEEQMTRLQGTGKVTDENLAANFLNAPTSKNRLSDDEYCQLWKRNFRFWNPDKEDSSRWITPFLIACHTKVVSKITPPPVQERKPAVGQEESAQTNHVQSGEMFPMPREETVSTVSSSSDHIPEETLVPIVQPIEPSNPTVSSEVSLTLSDRLNNSSPQPVAPVKIVEPAPEPPIKPVESVKAQDALVSASPFKTAAISLDLRVKLNQTRAILWSYLSEKERALRMRMVVQEKTKFDIGYINSLASLELMNTSHTSIHSGRSTTVPNFSSFTIVDNRTSSNRCLTPGYHPPLHTSSPKYPVINPL